MIAKGASRSGPRQLAVYLMRVERYETGEPVDLLELQSPWAESLDDGSSRPRIASRMIETFRDWQTLTEGTKQGRDGLYHAEISPEAHYAATMTPEQWKRAADILGQELGLQDQARAIVLHGGTDGRKHLHVVWARTDIDAMKLVSDSNNYLANERASKRMELEFGHEFVPGKHAKRDRELQPEFPRQELTQDEDQQQKRTGLKVADRKAEIAALHAAADNAQAFKAALEDAGYLLAKGEKGYIIVDETGGHSLVSRNLGLKKKEVDAFMAGIELDKLPTIEEAKALQKEARQREKVKAPEAQKPAPEASKFLQPAAPEKVEEPAPAPPSSKFLPKADAPTPVAPPKAPEVKPFDYELYANYNRQPAPKAPELTPEPLASKFLPQADAPAPVSPPAPEVKPFDYELYANYNRQPAPPAPVVAPPDQPASKFLPAKETVQPPPAAEKPAGIDLTLYAPKAPAPVPPKVPPAPEPTTAPDSGAPAYDWTRYALKPEFKGLEPPAPPPPKRPWEAREIRDLRKSIFKAQAEEYQKFADQNGVAYKQHGIDLDGGNRTKMEDFDHKQRAELLAFRERLHTEPAKGIRGMMDALKQALNPKDDDALAAVKQEELALFKSQQAHDRRDYMKTLEQAKRDDLAKFREAQLVEQAARERGYNEEIERRIAEFKEGKRLKADIVAPATKRREPLPSDPWMAQIGGIHKLSPDHLASAQRSYDAWSRKQEYSLENYVSYVQRQWVKVELPPVPQAAAPQTSTPAYDPTTYAPKAAPKTDPWTDAELKSKFNALQGDPEIERRIAEFKEGQAHRGRAGGR